APMHQPFLIPGGLLGNQGRLSEQRYDVFPAKCQVAKLGLRPEIRIRRRKGWLAKTECEQRRIQIGLDAEYPADVLGKIPIVVDVSWLTIQNEFSLSSHAALGGQPILINNQKILSSDGVFLPLVKRGRAEWNGLPEELADVRSNQVARRDAAKQSERS